MTQISSLPVAATIVSAQAGDDTIALTYAARMLRRKRLVSDAGTAFLVDLPDTRSLDEGDAFELENGTRVAVRAADEDLIEMTGDLVRLAWHIGNRHTPCEIGPGVLRIQDDHVLRAMLDQLGATTRVVRAPFRPEGGAYGHGRTWAMLMVRIRNMRTRRRTRRPKAGMDTLMAIEASRDLLTLTQWLSPAFPLGAFAYSHGLETAITSGAVRTADDLSHWLSGVLRDGSGRSDAVLLSMVLNGADAQATDAVARALAAGPERLQESLDQGRAFLRVSNALQGGDDQDLTLPVALGVHARSLRVAPEIILALYLQGFASNLVQAAVRLVPLGQTEGQQVLQRLAPVIDDLARTLATSDQISLASLASAAVGADLAAMAHETQEIRLFRS